MTFVAKTFLNMMKETKHEERTGKLNLKRDLYLLGLRRKEMAEDRRKKKLRDKLEAKKQKACKEAQRQAEKARKWGNAFKDKIREHARETYVNYCNLNQEDVRAKLKQKELEEEWAQRKIEVNAEKFQVRVLSTKKRRKKRK